MPGALDNISSKRPAKLLRHANVPQETPLMHAAVTQFLQGNKTQPMLLVDGNNTVLPPPLFDRLNTQLKADAFTLKTS